MFFTSPPFAPPNSDVFPYLILLKNNIYTRANGRASPLAIVLNAYTLTNRIYNIIYIYLIHLKETHFKQL